MRYYLLRNTYTGIKEVEPSLTEAAKGIGMKPMRRLTKVELPIACQSLWQVYVQLWCLLLVQLH